MYEFIDGSLCFYVKRDGVHWWDVPSVNMSAEEFMTTKLSVIELVRQLNDARHLNGTAN